MQKHFLFIACFIATISVATAQKKAPKEKELDIEFGKIPVEDIKMRNYSLDSSAEAVVLAAKGELSVEEADNGFRLNYHYFRRVKLLKKSAFDSEGNIEITYYSKDSYEDLQKVKAAVIQPNGIRQELTKKDFFEEKTTKNYTTKKIAFPNLTEGCIIEYDYEMYSKNISTLKSWQFQENIPVRHSELWIANPQYYDYVYLMKGRLKLKESQIKGSQSGGVQYTTQKMYLDSVTALKPEGYITTMSDYMSRISFQLKRINYPTGRIDNILTDWKTTADELTSNSYLGSQFLKKSNYGDVWRAVKPLLEKAKTDDEKIKITYEYLCNNVNWDEDNYSESSDESLNAAFKKKKANSGELNMMLIACLTEAGVKAFPMLVSTRGHGKPITTYPIMSQFNHLACYIDRGEKSQIIDVGTINRPIGLPRVTTLNQEGWILDKKNPRWVPIVAPLSNETSLATFRLDEEGTLKGSIASNYRGYAAVIARDEEQDKEKNHEKVKKDLTKDFPDIQIDSITMSNLENTAEPFKRVVHCVIPNAATTAGDLIYIKPSLKTDFDENPFKQPKREYPVEFPYPFRDQFVLNLTIPQGYKVEEMPKSVKYSLLDNAGSFQYISSVTGDRIQFMIKIQLDQLTFQPEDYEGVKQFFNQIAAKSAEQVVLKKK
ncbi:MAG: DUF3857 domain-containing protein [Saprospiraceae bacterium]|nr:DUF3857 domain-containing protein [Saprospiraceae bacterium]